MSLAETSKPGSVPTAWHAMSAEDVEKKLRVDPNRGLDVAEAAERLKSHGPNRLPQGKKKGPLMRFLAQFNNILVYVLLTAGFVKLMLSLWLDASIIFAVVHPQFAAGLPAGGPGGEGARTRSAICFRQRRAPFAGAKRGSFPPRTWRRAISSCSSPATRSPRTCA